VEDLKDQDSRNLVVRDRIQRDSSVFGLRLVRSTRTTLHFRLCFSCSSSTVSALSSSASVASTFFLFPDQNPDAHELQSSLSLDAVELKLRRDSDLSMDGRPGREGMPKRGRDGIFGRLEKSGMMGMFGRFDMLGILGMFGRLKGNSDVFCSADCASSKPVIVRCKCNDGDDPRPFSVAGIDVGIPVCGSRSGNG